MKRAADDSTLEELGRAKAVLEGHGPGGDMRKLLKQPTPALLTLLLGRHCNLVTLQVWPSEPPAFSSATEGRNSMYMWHACSP